MKFSQLDGMKVYTSDAGLVGEVSGADLNTKKWCITHLHIELAEDAVTKLGHKKPFLGHITINLPTEYIKLVGDMVTLDCTLQELRKIPSSK